MVAKRQSTENSWAQIDVALRRRHDLIPALVESVKGYATHERTTFEAVTEARTEAIAAEGAAAAGRGGGPARPGDRPPAGRRRGLPAARGEQQLLPAADRPARHGGPDRDHPARLQRHRRDLQHGDSGLPGGDRRAPVRLSPARVLRRAGGGRGDAAGEPLPRADLMIARGLLAAARGSGGGARARRARLGRRRHHRRGRGAAPGAERRPAGHRAAASSTTTGTFEGSYRDIDLLHGERIGDVSVSQDGADLPPRRQHRARQPRRAGRLRGHVDADRRPDRLALPGLRRAADHGALLPRPRRASSPTTTCSTSAGPCGARSGTSTSPT